MTALDSSSLGRNNIVLLLLQLSAVFSSHCDIWTLLFTICRSHRLRSHVSWSLCHHEDELFTPY